VQTKKKKKRRQGGNKKKWQAGSFREKAGGSAGTVESLLRGANKAAIYKNRGGRRYGRKKKEPDLRQSEGGLAEGARLEKRRRGDGGQKRERKGSHRAWRAREREQLATEESSLRQRGGRSLTERLRKEKERIGENRDRYGAILKRRREKEQSGRGSPQRNQQSGSPTHTKERDSQKRPPLEGEVLLTKEGGRRKKGWRHGKREDNDDYIRHLREG